jgi:hypothetical protein
MSVLTDYGLKEDDVEFLLTVHQIEQNPMEYDNTDPGEAVANVTVLKQASDLSKNQIDYRAREGDNSRGLAGEEMNLIRSYAPQVEGKEFEPRSVELTKKGKRVVAEIKELRSGRSGQPAGSGGASSERIAELEAQVSELQSQIENFSEIAETVAAIEQNEMGGVGSEMTTQIRAASNAIPHHQFVFSEVFGIGIEDMHKVDEDDEEGIRQLQVTAYNHLQQALDESESGE